MIGKVTKFSADEVKHTGDATCLLYLNGYLYSGGADGKIKVWNDKLELVKDINAHDSYIYAICANSKGVIYSSSCDGTIKYFENPLANSCEPNILMKTDHDEIISLVCVDDVLYSGDDKGIVIKWVDKKITFKYNIVEEVRSMAVEKNLLYTARDLDCVITDLLDGKTGRYVTKATIEGRAPVTLFGPKENEISMYLVFTTRSGKGISLVRNKQPFDSVWNKEDAHEMIINTVCASGSDLYTAGYDGKVKKWIEVENSPRNVGEVTIGRFINAICMGADSKVYVADTTGVISEVCFSSKAG
ncbi:hypothetical protein HA402_010470 [Bradysia odoriphaga]|nr:hypothetical protein HA402_010470 [Bradysia odoriphaga]